MYSIKLLLSLTVFYLLPLWAFTQVNETFSDGDFTSNPAWMGTTNSWMVNSSGQLQSNNTIANSSFYISTANQLAAETQWSFSVTLNFNTSSANYVDAFLIASSSDLSDKNTSGYFVRIGNTDDEISLYRKDANGISAKIIDGANSVTNSSTNQLKIKVTRNAAHQFTLLRDAGNSGFYTAEGVVTDSTYRTTAYFGFLVKQSTSSFFQKHFFKDIVVQPYRPDVTPPSVQSVVTTSANTLDILFSEPVELTSAQTITNYFVPDIGHPITALSDAQNKALVHVTFNKNFLANTEQVLQVSDIKDAAGNVLLNASVIFSLTIPQRFDVLIDEIMADPEPQVKLPNAEYIELKNVSGKEMNLKGWKLATYTAVSNNFPDYTLPADSFVLVTSTSQAANFSTYGNVLGVANFPSLNNDSGTIVLTSKENKLIHAVSYNSNWYNENAVKLKGGWSLEMIDTHYPCTGQSNWKASVDASGGSPGRKNSVDGLNKDVAAPAIKNMYAIDAFTIALIFNEPVDSSSAATITRYKLTPNTSVKAASVLLPSFTQIQLQLTTPLQAGRIYTMAVTGITDCAGNEMITKNDFKVGLPQQATQKDVVINELLFNPKPNTSDFIELYNRSQKIIDASALYIGNRNSTGAISSVKKLTDAPFYLFPGSYVVITNDAESLQRNYWVKNPDAVLAVTSMPTLPDKEGVVVVTDVQGTVLDEVHYFSNWHFALIADNEGVSLERIDPDEETQNKNNWHSAASTAGYGTPTYQNSQYKQSENVEASFDIMPKIFSPDNDGQDDMATIYYRMAESGYVANSTIFDATGRFVRLLAKNDILGKNGLWRWDGLDEKGQKLPPGIYILFTEIFNLQGKKQAYKQTVVLAKK